MTTNLIATIQGVPILRTTWEQSEGGAEMVQFTAGAQVDNDGSGGNPEGDPDFQNETSLKNKGRSLNAEIEPFVVVPPAIIQGTRGVVLGCLCICYNQTNGIKARGVVGDIGPRVKLGEVSVAMAKALGLSGSPLSGGTDSKVIEYTLYPGQAAPGYALQPS